MTKKEMIELLTSEYGYKESELVDEKGNKFTNAVLEDIIEEEENKATQSEPEEPKEEKSKTEESEEDIFDLDETVFEPSHNLKDDDLVLCMSGFSGGLTFVNPISGFKAVTSGFGQTMKIPYRDLIHVHNIATNAFTDGSVIVLNKDVQEELGLKDIYKNVITPKNVKRVIQLGADDLKRFIEKMPKGMKATLYDEARKMYQNGKIDSIHTVEVLENEFGVSLEDNAPISDVVK